MLNFLFLGMFMFRQVSDNSMSLQETRLSLHNQLRLSNANLQKQGQD